MWFQHSVQILDLYNFLDIFILAFPAAICVVSYIARMNKYLRGNKMNEWL